MDTRRKRFNELWVTEEQSPNMKLSLRVSDVLLNVKSPYQDILLVETGEYGKEPHYGSCICRIDG